jgi:maltose alpha-D-glucosyltransferase/alpha-amylase
VAVVRASNDGARGALVDALDEPGCVRVLLEATLRQQRSGGAMAALVGSTTGPDALGALEADPGAEPRRMGSDRDHTTLRYGERFVLKVMRRVDEGISPELEVSRFLARHGTDIAPRLCGALELERGHASPMTAAVVHGFVPNVGTAWQLTAQELGRYYDRVLARSKREPCPPPPSESPLLLAGRDPPQAVAEMMGAYRDTAAQIGTRIAELHAALAAGDGDPAFAPVPYTALDRRSKYQSLRNLSGKVLRVLRERLPLLPPAAQKEAAAILAREGDVVRSFEPLLRTRIGSVRIRTHGNLHLGHVLYTGKGFVVTDFNGFEALTLDERRRKRSPMRDLAWMARSFEQAAFRRLLDPASVRETDVDAARPWAMHWSSWASAAFLNAYLQAAAGVAFLPPERDQSAVLFDAFVLERALYQLRSDLDEPSATLMISLLGIAHILV